MEEVTELLKRYLDGVDRVRAGLLPRQHVERLRRKLEAEVRSEGCPHRNTEDCGLLTAALREGKPCLCGRNPNVGARPNESRSRGASVQRAGASVGGRDVQLDVPKCRHPEVCAWLGDAKREGRPCKVCGLDPRVLTPAV